MKCEVATGHAQGLLEVPLHFSICAAALKRFSAMARHGCHTRPSKAERGLSCHCRLKGSLDCGQDPLKVSIAHAGNVTCLIVIPLGVEPNLTYLKLNFSHTDLNRINDDSIPKVSCRKGFNIFELSLS